jgi:hypothetical protein
MFPRASWTFHCYLALWQSGTCSCLKPEGAEFKVVGFANYLTFRIAGEYVQAFLNALKKRLNELQILIDVMQSDSVRSV